jgi:Tfp pilus assembly protein PilP
LIKKIQFVSLILVLLLAGCSSYQSEEAEQLLQESRSHYQKALDYLNSFTGKTQVSSSNPSVLQANLKKAKGDLDRAQAELEVAAKSLERIKDLKVEEWRVKHAELLIKSIEAEEKALKYARNYAEGLQEVVSSAGLLEVSAEEIKAGSNYLNQASTAISKKKWSEADSKLKQARKELEKALAQARQLKTSGLGGITEYENFILTMIKLTNQFSQFNQALKKSQTSRAKTILKQIEATSSNLEKTNLKNLSADEILDLLYQQFTKKLKQLESEAESFRNSADKLYQESTS